MSESELNETFGSDGYKKLPDEVLRRYYFVPAQVGLEEIHIGVYSNKKTDEMIKAKFPQYLSRGSLVSPSLEAGIINAKYVNSVPFYRLEKQFERDGLDITRQEMARWSIQSAERYLSVFYDYLHSLMYEYHVLQVDETPLFVNKDGRSAGSKSYMWVYRTGECHPNPIVLYDYQKTRNTSHPREFLKDFKGICVTDGYQVYHTLEKEREDLTIAGCWAHARRRFDEALKAMHKSSPKGSMSYSVNQEKYLRAFLDDPYVPLDNNAAERAIRNFCIGKKNFVMIDTISGAKSSAIIYSLVETDKANNLNIYEYVKYLLTVIPGHMDDHSTEFCKELLPWSETLPEECRKKK